MSIRAGIHADVPAVAYHADPAPEPSLSASVAHTLCARSPLHAWCQHPRLNGDYKPEVSERFDVGTAAHAFLLSGEDVCEIIEAPDWRTAAARDARDEARAAGLVPLLAHQWDEVTKMCAAVRLQLDHAAADPTPLTDGKPEQTLLWEEDGVWCRARCDWLRDDRAAIDDLKTTTSADPREWGRRRLWEIGADIQAAFYLRGLKALEGRDADFRWVVCETSPPYAVSVVALAPSARELAEAKVEWAIDTWRECLKSGRWPAYTTEVAHVDAPAWEFERWAEARYIEEEAA